MKTKLLLFTLLISSEFLHGQCVNGTNITCGQTISNVNLPNPGTGGGSDPTTGNNGCNPCCYSRADLNNDGIQDVNFSVENPRYYDIVIPPGFGGTVTININTSNGNNLQGAVFNCTQAGNDLNCGHSGSDVHDSSPGGHGPFTMSSAGALPGNTLFIMVDSYGGCCTGPFDITITCSPLAVVLENHTVIHDETGNLLQWSMSPTSHASQFRIERIRNGSVEKEIPVAVNTENKYEILDQVSFGGLMYKLISIESDGTENVLFSEYVEEFSPGESHTSVSIENVYATPGKVNTSVTFSESTVEGLAECIIHSIDGRQISSMEVMLRPGKNEISIPFSGMDGMYFLQVKTPKGSDSKSLVVMSGN